MVCVCVCVCGYLANAFSLSLYFFSCTQHQLLRCRCILTTLTVAAIYTSALGIITALCMMQQYCYYYREALFPGQRKSLNQLDWGKRVRVKVG